MKLIRPKSAVVLLLCSFTFTSLSHAYNFTQNMVSGVQATSSSKKSNQYVIKNSQHAAKVVKGAYGGKVLKVKKLNSKNSPAYRVKLVRDNGHVISVVVDAKSGQIKGK